LKALLFIMELLMVMLLVRLNFQEYVDLIFHFFFISYSFLIYFLFSLINGNVVGQIELSRVCLSYCKWQSSFSRINFFICKNKGKFIVFEKLDCNLQYFILFIFYSFLIHLLFSLIHFLLISFFILSNNNDNRLSNWQMKC
jgi:hypothetical protein